jgi:ribose 1,5-bisphosphokinase
MGCGASSNKQAVSETEKKEDLKQPEKPEEEQETKKDEKQQQQQNDSPQTTTTTTTTTTMNTESTSTTPPPPQQHEEEKEQHVVETHIIDEEATNIKEEQEVVVQQQQQQVEDSVVIDQVDKAVDELKDLEPSQQHNDHQNNTSTTTLENHTTTNNTISGQLFLVLGPSGVGKDTLMNGARKSIGESNSQYHFAQRYITRPKSDNPNDEDHIPLSDEDFDGMVNENQFVLHWNAHSLKYGIGREIIEHLSHNRNVIVNVSRTVIEQAQNDFKTCNVTVVEINADSHVIRDRLIKRGRESEQDINNRIQRGEEMAAAVKQAAKNLKRVLNNTTVDEGVDRLLVALQYLPEDSLEIYNEQQPKSSSIQQEQLHDSTEMNK